MRHFVVFFLAFFSCYGCAHTEYIGAERFKKEGQLLTEFQAEYPGQFKVADSSEGVCAALVSGTDASPVPTHVVIFFVAEKNLGNLLAALNIGIRLPSNWRYVIWLKPEEDAPDAKRYGWRRSYRAFITIGTPEEYKSPTTGDMGAVAVLKLNDELSQETCRASFLIGPMPLGDYGRIFYGGAHGVIHFKEGLLYR